MNYDRKVKQEIINENSQQIISNCHTETTIEGNPGNTI
jgi:hypothetical protein